MAVAPIVAATDLGNVMTLKHGDVFMLSDQGAEVLRKVGDVSVTIRL